MTKFERISGTVPPGTRLPDELRLLCDYRDRSGDPISGCMKIRPDDFGGVRAWFDNDEEMANRFAYFGAGPDGSILALWLLDGPDATTAPVVHLGSEGSNNVVLAKDFRTFMQLFGVGYDELGFDDLTVPPIDPDSAESLRAWLRTQFGVICPETGSGIVAEARASCPDVEEAVRRWYKARYGEDP